VSANNETELRRMIAAATVKVEDLCGPVIRRTVVERQPGGGRAVFLRQAPVISLASVVPVAGGTGITVGLLDVDQDSGQVAYADGYTCFPMYPAGAWLWTYVAGRAVIPEGLQLAALNFIRGSWETQRGQARSALSGADDTAEVPGMGLVNWRLEQDLVPYARLPGVA
jgi:hypothetical protein